MRRSYHKQETYIVHEKREWKNHHSHEDYHHVPSIGIPKMLVKSSFHDSEPSDHPNDDNIMLNDNHWFHHNDGSHGWCSAQPFNKNNNFIGQKNNKHHALGANSILRPPLGMVKPPLNHQMQHHQMFQGRQTSNAYDGARFSTSMEDDPRAFGRMTRIEGYDDKGVDEHLEKILKGINDGLGAGKVKKIEVIQYERTRTYGGGSGHSNNYPDQFINSYPNDHAPWVKGF